MREGIGKPHTMLFLNVRAHISPYKYHNIMYKCKTGVCIHCYVLTWLCICGCLHMWDYLIRYIPRSIYHGKTRGQGSGFLAKDEILTRRIRGMSTTCLLNPKTHEEPEKQSMSRSQFHHRILQLQVQIWRWSSSWRLARFLSFPKSIYNYLKYVQFTVITTMQCILGHFGCAHASL